MNLTDFYNHNSFMRGAREGEKLIANTPHNTEPQKFKIGDHVISSEISPYKLFPEDDAIIIDVIKTCYGFFKYDVEYKKPGCKRKRIVETFNEKNLARA